MVQLAEMNKAGLRKAIEGPLEKIKDNKQNETRKNTSHKGSISSESLENLRKCVQHESCFENQVRKNLTCLNILAYLKPKG